MRKNCRIVKPFFSETAPRDCPSCLPKTGKHACSATAEKTAFWRAEAAAFKPARRLLLRQPDAERGSAGLTLNINLAVMFVNNLLANIEAWAAARNIEDARGQRGKAAERSSQASAACSSCSMAISTARLAHSSRCFECFRKLMDSVIFC